MNMSTVKAAAARNGLELARSIREGDGWTTEADNALNDSSRALVHAMADEHGQAWLGKINRYNSAKDPIVWKWDESIVYNFSADFVLPCDDAELARMIEAHGGQPFKGARERVDAIIDRIKALGGHLLVWS
ncbi:MAG: hypothetical protein PVSMB8_00310 [Vulcanimicrobiaceae bacterium]